MTDESNVPSCFVISEIGASGSDSRVRADKIFNYVVEPAAKQAGIKEVVRADLLRDPGMITTQIVDQLVEADVVVADLTGLNPNVFYELGMRHSFKRPAIHLYDPNDNIPFDVHDVRAIPVGTDVALATAARDQLQQMLAAALEDPQSASQTPFSRSVDLAALLEAAEQSPDQVNSSMVRELSRMREELHTLANRARPPASSPMGARPAPSVFEHAPELQREFADPFAFGLSGTDSVLDLVDAFSFDIQQIASVDPISGEQLHYIPGAPEFVNTLAGRLREDWVVIVVPGPAISLP